MCLNVLYQFNEKYVPYAGISMVSLFENNKNIDKINIYVLGENLSDGSKVKIERQVDVYGRKVYFVDTKALVIKMQKLGIPQYRGSYATNMKMFISEYINNDIDRLMYIDSDTIICGDLSSLLSMSMDGKPIAMVLDSLCAKHKVAVGLCRDDYYFNGGIILFDVKKWNECRCTDRIMEHVRNVRAHYMAPDQDLINVIFRNEIKRLDISYNLQPIHSVYSYRQYYKYFGQKAYYSEREIENGIRYPKILHTFRYLGEFPWHKDSLHPHVEYFDKYMGISLWKDYQKEPTEMQGIPFKVERWLYKHIGKTVFLFVFKLNYEFFLWKSNRDSLKHRNNKNM
jgi:lipopolysaccharide biosynthesis glycosyltransferase